MTRVISLAVLLGVLALVAVLFYMVMASFIVPMFMAVVLVVMFRPLHQWFMVKCNGRGHAATALTTITILLIVLAPIMGVGFQAAREGRRFIQHYESSRGQGDVLNVDQQVTKALRQLRIEVSDEQRREIVRAIDDRVAEFRDTLVAGGLKVLAKTIVGVLIMIVALYFFLLDGPAMIDTMMYLVPMEDRHKQELLDRFTSVSRSVVVATLLAAVVQGLLAGIGFAVAGMPAVFLLMALTTLLAMVPFVGSISVWLPSCVYLYAIEERMGAAVGLAIYGTVVISQVDNLIKPAVLHGQSRLHPLFALLSVLGGVQALGPIGILVGPMAVAFLQTLLNMLRSELQRIDHDARPERSGPRAPLAPLLHRLRQTVNRRRLAR
jgi:predicted PurR-regulated permease PerM